MGPCTARVYLGRWTDVKSSSNFAWQCPVIEKCVNTWYLFAGLSVIGKFVFCLDILIWVAACFLRCLCMIYARHRGSLMSESVCVAGSMSIYKLFGENVSESRGGSGGL